MKKIDTGLKKYLSNMKFLQKYDYDISKVIGVKDNEAYILYTDKKLLRIYRNKLKSSPLLNSYVPIENVIFYNFELEKNILEKVDVDKFIETKIYEETGIDETERYIVKYKVIDFLQDEKKVMIEVVIVSEGFLYKHFEDILHKVGYIDYVSFPAFSYKSLYQEGILTLANDLFVVVLEDKIFLTFYSDGKLIKIMTISGGLDKIYKKLEKLNISNFNYEVFRKLLQQKGVDQKRYSSKEFIVYNEIVSEFDILKNILEEQIKKVIDTYNIETIDRIFITTKYGNVKGLEEHLRKSIYIDTFNFEFYENYNLDRLPIDPLLFLGMLETHYAYKNEDLSFNFSQFLRKPTFFYRPSGQLVLSVSVASVLFSVYPLYLYINGLIYEDKSNKLDVKIHSLNKEITLLGKKKNKLKKEQQVIKKIVSNLRHKIQEDKTLIKKVYSFKYSYIPKSEELTDITYYLNKNKVYIKDLSYKNNEFLIDIFSKKDSNIANLINELTNSGFNVYTGAITLKNNQYTSQIRIKE